CRPRQSASSTAMPGLRGKDSASAFESGSRVDGVRANGGKGQSLAKYWFQTIFFKFVPEPGLQIRRESYVERPHRSG
ncbi:MAG TPA: hypothetical protein VFG14_00320, partial [Chthoniobacteraceae bacterium]|nr:hypothetical protein [Chthoniobacteraceae bacterium]